MPRSSALRTLPHMNREPTQRELYDAILRLQGATSGLESRLHEFDEDFQGFRVEVHHRLDRIDGQLREVNRRLETLEAAWSP
jgi:hypothetical protein